jgi:hypothetical protein
MGLSYTVMLIAFYMDNGKNLAGVERSSQRQLLVSAQCDRSASHTSSRHSIPCILRISVQPR